LGLVWYNKDENNKYVGFSDGLYDLNYDEIEYLEKRAVDGRLLAQKGKENVATDKMSLNLAATVEEAKAEIDAMATLISKDLITNVRSF
jgi:hypothetical protein